MPEARYSARVEQLLAPGRALLARLRREQADAAASIKHLDFDCEMPCDRCRLDRGIDGVLARVSWNVHGCSACLLCDDCNQATRAILIGRLRSDRRRVLRCGFCTREFDLLSEFVSVVDL